MRGRVVKVHYYGHVGLTTGYGRAASDLFLALTLAGADVRVQLLSRVHDIAASFPELYAGIADRCHQLPLASDEPPQLVAEDADVVVVHTLPIDCAEIRDGDRRLRAARGASPPRYVAYTTWEACTVPDQVKSSLAGFDEVWVPSEWVAEILREHGIAGVRAVPHGVLEDEISMRRELGAASATRVPGPYRFFWSGAWTARKNPEGLLRAFAHAFQRDEPVELTLHSSGLTGDVAAAALGRLGIPQADLPPVRFDAGRLTNMQMLEVWGTVDCYVTAARGEAWNYTAWDAVLARRAVIAPKRAAAEEFLETQHGYWRVPSRVEPAMIDVEVRTQNGGRYDVRTVGAQGLTARDAWWEPDLRTLATTMRLAYEERLRDLEVAYDLPLRFGLRAVGRRALGYLEQLLS